MSHLPKAQKNALAYLNEQHQRQQMQYREHVRCLRERRERRQLATNAREHDTAGLAPVAVTSNELREPERGQGGAA